jgi:hypothetical protein
MSSNEKRDFKYQKDESEVQTKHDEENGTVDSQYESFNRLHQEYDLARSSVAQTWSLKNTSCNERYEGNRSVLLPLSPSRVKSAPSSPLLSHQRPQISKTSSLTSIEPLSTRENKTDTRRRRQNGAEQSTPPLSPALRRKLQNTDKIVREARMRIDDYRREHPTSTVTSIDVKPLGDALKEVQNCRYLRVVEKNDS